MEKIICELLNVDSLSSIKKHYDLDPVQTAQKKLPSKPKFNSFDPSGNPIGNDEERGLSLKKLKKLPYQERMTTENKIKETNLLLNQLNEQGLKATSDLGDKGSKIFQKQYSRIGNPMKPNPASQVIRQSSFDRAIKKYEMNKQYYSKSVEKNADMDELGFAPEMVDFILRKKKLEDAIKQNKNIHMLDIKGKKNSGEGIRESKIVKNISLPCLPQSSGGKGVAKQQAPIKNLDKIMTECSAVQVRSPSKDQKDTIFDQMNKKLEIKFNENHDIDQKLLAKAKEVHEREQHEKYKHDYLKIVRANPDYAKMTKQGKEELNERIIARKKSQMIH